MPSPASQPTPPTPSTPPIGFGEPSPPGATKRGLGADLAWIVGAYSGWLAATIATAVLTAVALFLGADSQMANPGAVAGGDATIAPRNILASLQGLGMLVAAVWTTRVSAHIPIASFDFTGPLTTATAGALALLLLLGWLLWRRLPAGGPGSVLARLVGVGALVWVTVALLAKSAQVAAADAMRLNATIEAGDTGSVLRSVLLIVGTLGLAAWLARGRTATPASAPRLSVRAAVTVLGSWLVLGGLVGIIVAIVRQQLNILLALPSVGVAAGAVGHLGALTVDSTTSGSRSQANSTLITAFSPDQRLWVLLLPLVGLALVVLTAGALAIWRGEGQRRNPLNFAWSALAFTGLWWVAIALVGRFGAQIDVGIFGSSSIEGGVSWWSLVPLAVTGLLIEALVFFAGDRVAGLLPAGLRRRLRPGPAAPDVAAPTPASEDSHQR